MEENYIVLPSFTYARLAKEHLYSLKIDCKIIRTPRELSSCGCSYSITFIHDKEEVIKHLRAKGIKLKQENS